MSQIQKIPLNNGLFAIVNDEYSYMLQWKWRVDNQGYAYRLIQSGNHRKGTHKGKFLYMHRIISGAKDGELTDHINRDKLDNRRENLRLCSHTQNVQNREKRRGVYSSKYKGVSWLKANKKWQANIRINKELKYLGSFVDEVDAAKAYDAMAIKHFGEFACLNFNS